MKSNAETTKDQPVKDQTPKTQPQAPKDPTPKAKAPKAKREPAARVAKPAKSDADAATLKAPVAQLAAAAVKPVQTEKVPKAPKASKAVKVENDAEPVDRLPATVEELKESKGGLVTFLFLSGRDKEDIAKELKAAFKLTDGQAAKIVRRITGRARFFQRALALTAAK